MTPDEEQNIKEIGDFFVSVRKLFDDTDTPLEHRVARSGAIFSVYAAKLAMQQPQEIRKELVDKMCGSVKKRALKVIKDQEGKESSS